MIVLVVGASGATGRLLVKELLSRNVNVRVVVRSANKLPDDIRAYHNLTVIETSILNLSDDELLKLTNDCDAVASCLGHNITFKGIFGDPKMLVTESVKRLCNSIKRNNPDRCVKFVLMNTTANNDKENNEKSSFVERLIFSFIYIALPPHRDNVNAANYLRKEIGQSNENIEWSIVRPDSLITEESVTEYKVFPSLIRSPLFDSGKTSRNNVGHFMAELILNNKIWNEWKGKMPVIYNKDSCLNK